MSEKSTATAHFLQRAAERMGYRAAQARELADGLVWAIEQERDDVAEFVSRVNRDGLRLFRFRAVDARLYYALVNTDTMTCISIMPPGFTVPRQGKSRLKLKDADI